MIKKSEIKNNLLKPGDVAQMLNVSTRTIQNYSKQNKLEVVWTDTGRRLITRESTLNFLDELGLLINDDNRYDVIYARVSTHKQKERGDLDRQVNKLIEYAIVRNPKNLEILTDVGSGLNDNRKSLNKLIKEIQEDKIDRIFISYKDRLTRYGFNLIQTICNYHNTEIIVISQEEYNKSVEEELAEDIISIIHSFSGKLYGLRKKIRDSLDEN